MKSRGVKRFLAIFGACVITVTSTPITTNAAEVSPGVTVEDVAQDEKSEDEKNKATATPSGSGEVKDSATVGENDASKVEATPTVTPNGDGQADDTAEGEDVEAPVPTEKPSGSDNTSTDVPVKKPSVIEDIANSTAGMVPVVPKDKTSVSGNDLVQQPSGEQPAETVEPDVMSTATDTASISTDTTSGKNAYHPIESEFTVQDSGDKVLITAFNPTLSQSYDLVCAPGEINGKPATYGADFINSINGLKKGIIFESGAELVTSTTAANISYVRFDTGAKTTLTSRTFADWKKLSSVVGYGEALVSGGATSVNFDSTFAGCVSLAGIDLNLGGITAEFTETFAGVEDITSINISDAKVNKVYRLNPGAAENTSLFYDAEQKTVKFSNIEFPANDTAYLSHAFTNMPGKLVFNNCTSEGTSLLNFDSSYAESTIFEYDDVYDAASAISFEPGTEYCKSRSDLYISISGAQAASAVNMFAESQLLNVDLAGLITADTKAINGMFKNATVAGLNGVSTWRLGEATADEAFWGTRVYFGKNSYLTKTLIPDIKKMGWSGVTSVNKLFGFEYKGDCPISYAGMDLSGVDCMTVSDSAEYDFISASTNPSTYMFSKDKVYALAASEDFGGKLLVEITVDGGSVSGEDIPTDTRIYTNCATIKVVSVPGDAFISTDVVPGFKLGSYLGGFDGKFYSDKSLTQEVDLESTVEVGSTITLYHGEISDDIECDLVEGSSIDFGNDTGSINITMSDGTTDKLTGGSAVVSARIADASKPSSSMNIPDEVKNLTKSDFFNIDLIANVGGNNKKITELSKAVTVTLPMPADYESGRMMVLNYHEGFDKAPIVLAGTVNKSAGTVTFKTDKFSPYVLMYGEKDGITTTTKNVVVDFSSLSGTDMQSVRDSSGLIVQLYFKYEDGSEVHLQENLKVTNTNVYRYTLEYDVPDQNEHGSKFKEFTNISTLLPCKGKYENVVDLENMTLSFTPVAEDSTETTKYNFAVKVVDNSNAAKTRPETLEVKFTAKYDAYSRDKIVKVNLKGMTGNTANAYVEFPTTVGGKTMTSLDATTTTGNNIGYSSTWDNNAKLFKYILAGATDTDPDPTPGVDPATVAITFVGDVATSRPSSITITLADSKGGNVVTKNLVTAFSPTTSYYADTFQRLVDDTYHVVSVSGIDATKYDVVYSGLNITATYKTNNGTTTNSKRTVTITMEDNNDEAGLRPKSMKVVIANNSGSDSITQEVKVGSDKSFTFDVNVTNANDEYKVKSVSGLPESYKVDIDGLKVTCKYTPEKIQKTYKVVWSGDGDNADKTRPGSVQLTVKNSGSSVQTVTVSEDTNWSANVSLNKHIKGVEASYSLEGADVTNYSKSVDGDTVTYKFTGTLSKDAAAIEANKNGGAGAAGAEGVDKEVTYDIANFDWIDYANRYPDLKKAYGYNKEALYAHYIRYGIGEGRIATFTGKYATVNEDILKAYFPDDYKYKTDMSIVDEEYLIGADKKPSTGVGSSSTTDGNKVTVDSDGNVHTTVKNADGTVTETVTDKDGNIISVSTYKTGDLRLEDMSLLFIALGVLMLISAALIIRVVIKDDKRKKSVLSMIS